MSFLEMRCSRTFCSTALQVEIPSLLVQHNRFYHQQDMSPYDHFLTAKGSQQHKKWANFQAISKGVWDQQ